ncbi:dihydropteroate synthase [Enterococcus sp. 8G7_MSG3316]|uniref:Dihydropteroate synthase n=1 Tax=Candidatus Enterococcus testudinis TaxID=1834191 RepID=A0A242A6I5_9ENTE|nr:dihydropteroate synthase [Enterococcus sp. 8G7_MSG3316]OTN76648.1 dihydropteroate synthase [Enterococcus sp. 8G7_MSG3316]
MIVSEVGESDYTKILVQFSDVNHKELLELKFLVKKVGARIEKVNGCWLVSFNLTEIDFFINECEKLNYFVNNIEILEKIFQENRLVWKGRNFSFDLTKKPIIVSIVNCTPDSFYNSNNHNEISKILHKVEKDLVQGASVIELGGKSVRPGFKDISPEVEWMRLTHVIENIKKYFPNTVLSVDTDNAYVMMYALKEYQVDIINDVTGFDNSKKIEIIKDFQPSLVVMNNGRKKIEFRLLIFLNILVTN